MTAVLEPLSVCPLAEVPDYPPVDPDAEFEAFEFTPVGTPVVSWGSNTFVDCELVENELAEGESVTLTTAGSYTITIQGNCTITKLAPNKTVPFPGQAFAPNRYDTARELTPEILESAAALMERVGRYQGDLWPGARTYNVTEQPYEGGSPLCAWGAVLVTIGVTQMSHGTSIEELLWDEHRVLHNIAVFNDDPNRAQREVVEELRHRARLLRQLQAA